MDIPQLDANSCVIPITLSLWTWTRFKSTLHRSSSDSLGFPKQTRAAHAAFVTLLALECLALLYDSSAVRWLLCAGSVAVFLAFSMNSGAREGQFWSKERNRMVGISLSLVFGGFLALILTEPIFMPLFAALAIAGMCHNRFGWALERQSHDLEALHAKLLKQEAQNANERHFRYTK